MPHRRSAPRACASGWPTPKPVRGHRGHAGWHAQLRRRRAHSGVPGTPRPSAQFAGTAGAVALRFADWNMRGHRSRVPGDLHRQRDACRRPRAHALGRTGYESRGRAQCQHGAQGAARKIRLEAGPLWGWATCPQGCAQDDAGAPPRNGGRYTRARSFRTSATRLSACSARSRRHRLRRRGTVASRCASAARPPKTVSVEHPSGEFTVELEMSSGAERSRGDALRATAHGAGLFAGDVFVPRPIWDGQSHDCGPRR